MVGNILSKINKGKRAKEVTVVLDNKEHKVIGVVRSLDKVQLVVEPVITKKKAPKKKEGEVKPKEKKDK